MTTRAVTKVEDQFIAPMGRVLVVDDRVENLLVVESLLSRTLLQIDRARSGKECIASVSKKDYHVILMDYMMPDMDGIETLHELKKNPKFSTPVVALTANVVAGIKETLLNEGFSEYLSKPITGKQLEEILIGLLPADLITMIKPVAENHIAPEIQKRFEAIGAAFGIQLEEGLGYLSGDLFQYKNLATFFVDSYSKDKLEVLAAEISSDWRGLKYLVHSLKSKARAVGAVNLSETAAKLEEQCPQEDEGYIKVTLPLLYYEWHRVIEGLKEIIAGLDELPTDNIKNESPFVSRGELLTLLKHNRQPDALLAIEQMIAFSQGEETKEKLKEIWKKVDEIEFRDAERLLIAMGGETNGK